MTLGISASADYDLEKETFLILMVEPAIVGTTHRVLHESLRTTPLPECVLTTDLHSNPQRCILAPKGFFTFDFTASIETEPNNPIPEDGIEHAVQEIPYDLLHYLLPSQRCPADQLRRMAQSEFGRITKGGKRVQAVADWVNRHIAYRYETLERATLSEQIPQSACDTAVRRIGCADDFAHLVIAFCRALDLPARYAFGYALGLEPSNFHAWAQVYLSGRWHNLDATHKKMRPALIPIAFGRDAGDVIPLRLWNKGRCQAQSILVEQTYP